MGQAKAPSTDVRQANAPSTEIKKVMPIFQPSLRDYKETVFSSELYKNIPLCFNQHQDPCTLTFSSIY